MLTLSHSAPTPHQHMKMDSVNPQPAESIADCHLQQIHKLHDHVNIQHMCNTDIQASRTLQLSDQNIIFDQNGIPQDGNN
jgi:hypothetical protein